LKIQLENQAHSIVNRRHFLSSCLAGSLVSPGLGIAFDKKKFPNTDSHLPVDPEPVIRVDEGDDIAEAVARINNAGRGTLVWGRGTFAIPAITPQYTVLNFSDLESFKMYGQGPDATRLMQDISPELAVGQLRLCALSNVANFDISDFSIDGQNARYELPDSPATGENAYWKSRGEKPYTLHNNREAMSSFFMRKVHKGRFRNLHNVSARGDFINMANAFDILIHGCDIADCGRNGITLGGQRGLEWSHNVEIDSCIFRSDIDTQMIDLELHGKGTATRSELNRNVHVHHCQFEAQSPDDDRDMDQFAIVMNEVLDFTIAEMPRVVCTTIPVASHSSLWIATHRSISVAADLTLGQKCAMRIASWRVSMSPGETTSARSSSPWLIVTSRLQMSRWLPPLKFAIVTMY